MECPGYRDLAEQVFRDESCKVKEKAQKTYRKRSIGLESDVTPSPSSQVSMDVASDGGAGCTLELFNRGSESLSWWMGFSIDDVALTHFMSSYIPGSRFEFLPSMYSNLGSNLCLPATIGAVSKARLAWELAEPGILKSARSSYAKALTQLNLSLSNPRTATDDSTLVSVLLLSLFETMVWAGTGVPNNWVAHTRGAMALIKLRGKGQLNTEIGLQLFTQVINIVSVECIRLRERLPQEIVDLQAEVLRGHEDDPIYRVCRYTVELANLVARMAGGDMTTNQVVEETTKMDKKYVAFAQSLTLTWGYHSVVLDEDDPEAYGRVIHQYYRPRAAQIWNSIRMTRILLNGILHGYASMLSLPSAASILTQAEYNRALMATDICATVPYFLNSRTFTIASATTLLWPLSSVRSSLIPQNLRDYAEQSLRRLGQRLRVPGAEVVASDSEVEPLQEGLHMFYLT